ncbi:MAG: hypothetical protein A3G34_13915 [Candidatus Lindowbacteria bacterium RIFCSPLOWO2_12_FULL_62_27]|nr:MAG: hypothetical protein A3I06_04060 [Candidatus Lindowbacteria bacterium RIFCSPLOWO2_02_FULL_62_12]OGH62667.1 MAG: hypothetical protein A3G34_13915 [Candidatus Lindowbacteria bacterium RIFCSPLOWO2_12_FULL_62_27]
MSPLILDEWLWADLLGENGVERQKQASAFLLAIRTICNPIVIVKGSKFERKTFNFWKNAGFDATLRKIAKFYRSEFWSNSVKTIRIEAGQLKPLWGDLQKQVNPDDHYILQAYFTIQKCVIVTTDTRLKPLLDSKNIDCKYRDEFVSEYLAKFRKMQAP